MTHLKNTKYKPEVNHFLEHGWTIIDAPSIVHDTKKVSDFFALLKKIIQQEVYNEGKNLTFDYGNIGDPDDGFVNRSSQDGYDDKIFWHNRPKRLHQLYQHRFGSEPSKEFLQLMEFNTKVMRQTQKIVISFLEELEASIPEYNKVFTKAITDPYGEQDHVTRMILYHPKKTHEASLATEHQDRCFITAHVYQNMSGLYLIDKNGKKIFYQQKPGKMLLFASKQMTILSGGEEKWTFNQNDGTPKHKTIGGRFPAVYHGVQVDAENSGKERHVLVNFFKGPVPFKKSPIICFPK